MRGKWNYNKSIFYKGKYYISQEANMIKNWTKKYYINVKLPKFDNCTVVLKYNILGKTHLSIKG